MALHKDYRTLLLHGKVPDQGWPDVQIQHLLYTLSTLDTNHPQALQQQPQSHHVMLADDTMAPTTSITAPPRWCGVGEREGRVYSSWVLQRHAGLSHGMGRSGDLVQPQPKAVGSSVLVQLATQLVQHLVTSDCGLKQTARHVVLVPMCTGMTLSLVLSSLRPLQSCAAVAFSSSSSSSVPPLPTTNHQKYIVLWSRIDQKSCFKAIAAAGYTCVVLPTQRVAGTDAVGTDLAALQEALEQYRGRIVAIVTTTSCFAPRIPDAVDAVAQLVQAYNTQQRIHDQQYNNDNANPTNANTTPILDTTMAHVINHAYGLQCRETNRLLERACTIGQVDAVVCSLDKNFLVPVGGAVVLSPSANRIQAVGQAYAGRASISPMVDVCVTLLAMGRRTYQQWMQQRRTTLLPWLQRELHRVATRHGERLLQCPGNTISLAVTLNRTPGSPLSANDMKDKDGDKKDSNKNQPTTAAASTTTTTDPHLETHKTTNQTDTSNNTNQDDDPHVPTDPQALSGFGSMLFRRCVSGTRVVPQGIKKTMNGVVFHGFGSSHDQYPHSYLTAACALGVTAAELHEFIQRLDKTLTEFHKQHAKKLAKKQRQEQQEEEHEGKPPPQEQQESQPSQQTDNDTPK